MSPQLLHVVFQFYFNVRTNLHELSPEQILNLEPLPTAAVQTSEVDPGVRSALAIKEKVLRVTWLQVFVELGPVEAFKRSTLPPGMMVDKSHRQILALCREEHLLRCLDRADCLLLLRCLEVLKQLWELDPEKTVQEYCTATGRPFFPVLVDSLKSQRCNLTPYVAHRMLDPGVSLNQNILDVWTEALSLWLGQQFRELEQLVDELGKACTNGVWTIAESEEPFRTYKPDLRPLERLIAGFRRLQPALGEVSKVASQEAAGGEHPQLLSGDIVLVVRAIQAAYPFDIHGSELKRGLEALQRGDMSVCAETRLLEFAVLNLEHPVRLLHTWQQKFPENEKLRARLGEVGSRLNRILLLFPKYGSLPLFYPQVGVSTPEI